MADEATQRAALGQQYTELRICVDNDYGDRLYPCRPRRPVAQGVEKDVCSIHTPVSTKTKVHYSGGQHQRNW
jgi:hypothetical protein